MWQENSAWPMAGPLRMLAKLMSEAPLTAMSLSVTRVFIPTLQVRDGHKAAHRSLTL